MRILILGASGLVGGNCLKYFKTKEELEVVGTYFSYKTEDTVKFNTLDLNDPENYDVDSFKPDVVVHCGALTWVDYCEDNKEESWQKTVKSTQNALKIALRHDARFVYISSDYVFDGTGGPYTEDNEENPVSVYGKHKLEAEENVLQSGLDFLILRITNVFGDEARGKNFVARMIKNVQKGEEMTLNLPFDQYATPVNAADVARAMYLLLRDEKMGIYNIASTDYMNRVQLATHILKYFPNHKVKIRSLSTREINPPAPRPLVGGLITAKFLSEYPNFHFTNVDDYVRKKAGDFE
jgi:dTDP-4-dehydrorhamnose reductase